LPAHRARRSSKCAGSTAPTRTINYATEDLRARIKDLTDGKGVDVIYDAVGGPYTEPAFRSIAWRGRLLVIGFAAGEIPKLPLNLALLKGASIVGVFWGDFTRREPEGLRRKRKPACALVRQGPAQAARFRDVSAGEDGEALNLLASRQAKGKVVIVP
jgi:NADPH2:quinone reductase